MNREAALPIEHFIQALTSQLDRAQDTMALKARTGRPLTFAVKDLSLELRTHIETVRGVVHIRPAGPGEGDASMLHLSLTTITRPMIEENTIQMAADVDEPSLKEAVGDEMSEEEQRRLEWVGVHSVSQLRELQQRSGEQAIERVSQIPVMRLRAALQRASRPMVRHVLPQPPTDKAASEHAPLLRIRGHNLMQDRPPEVRIGGERVSVLEATDKELVVAPLAHQLGGTLVVETAPGIFAETEFQVGGPQSIPVADEKPTDSGGAP